MTTMEKQKVKFPDNLKVKGKVIENRISITQLSEEIGVSRVSVNNTLNGHKKGINIIPAIQKYLNNLK